MFGFCLAFVFDSLVTVSVCVFVWGGCNVLVGSNEKKINFVLLVRRSKESSMCRQKLATV